MYPRLGALLAFIGLLVGSKLGWADEPSVALTWTGPPDCQDDGTLEREIKRIIGDSTDVRGNEPIQVRAEVARQTNGTWLVQLWTRTGRLTGERKLVGATCAEVRRATALIVALMINPNVHVEPAPSAATKPPPARASPEPARAIQPAPTSAPSSTSTAPQAPRTTSFWIGAGLMGGVGVLPGASAGAQLALGLELGALVIELNGGAWLPRDKRSGDADGTAQLNAGGEFELQEANLLTCYRAGNSPALGVCAGGGARHMTGTGFGVSDPGKADASWAAFVMQGFVDVPLSNPWSVRSSLTTEIPFRPPTFSLAGVGDVHTPEAFAGHIDLALRFRF